MASPLARIVAGFTQGAAGYAANAIQQREADDRAFKKQQLLEQLRAETNKDLARYEDFLRSKRGDKDMSGADGNDFVTRNDRGDEISRRSLSEDELAARDYTKLKRQSDLDSTQADIDYKRGRLDVDRAQLDESRADRADRIAARAEDRATKSGVGNVDVNDPSSFGQALQSLEAAATQDAINDGVPGSKVSQLASITAAQEVQNAKRENRKPNLANARTNYLKGLDYLYGGTEGTGDSATWSKDEYRKSRGLGN